MISTKSNIIVWIFWVIGCVTYFWRRAAYGARQPHSFDALIGGCKVAIISSRKNTLRATRPNRRYRHASSGVNLRHSPFFVYHQKYSPTSRKQVSTVSPTNRFDLTQQSIKNKTRQLATIAFENIDIFVLARQYSGYHKLSASANSPFAL